jgi:hypothetical protein
MNVKLLKRVKKAILAEPQRVNMDVGIATREHEGDNVYDYPACGTIGCIAGWSTILARTPRATVKAIEQTANVLPHAWWYSVNDNAIAALDITSEQASILFHVESWPGDLQSEIEDYAEQTPEYAAVVAKAINRFIADPDKFVREGWRR